LRFLNFLKLFLIIIISGITTQVLTGCASLGPKTGIDSIGSYPDSVGEIKKNIETSSFKKAVQESQDLNSGSDSQLSGLELGRTYQLSGDYLKSQTAYDQVLAQVRINQAQAKIEVGRLLAQTGSLLVNPQLVPYRLAPYEVVYLLGYEALDQIALNNPSNALVYLRQAYEEQEFIQSNQAKELAEADKKSQEKSLSFNFNPADHPKEFSATLNAASHIKNGFENAWVYYLTALTYFSQGDQNNAFVAIKKALELAPDNPAVRNLLINILIKRGGDLTQLHQYLANFGLNNSPNNLPTIPKDSGLVVVLYEQDWVPAMSSVSIPLPIGWGGSRPQMQWLSLPVYSSPDLSISPLMITQNNGKNNSTFQTGQTSNLMNVYDLAAKNLMDRYPIIVVQAVLSVIAKAAVTAGLADSQSSSSVAGLIALAGSVYGALTSNADCRSWLTLPANEQVWQAYLPNGSQVLNLSNNGHNTAVNLLVRSSKVNLIWVVQAGNLMQAHVFELS